MNFLATDLGISMNMNCYTSLIREASTGFEKIENLMTTETSWSKTSFSFFWQELPVCLSVCLSVCLCAHVRVWSGCTDKDSYVITIEYVNKIDAFNVTFGPIGHIKSFATMSIVLSSKKEDNKMK